MMYFRFPLVMVLCIVGQIAAMEPVDFEKLYAAVDRDDVTYVRHVCTAHENLLTGCGFFLALKASNHKSAQVLEYLCKQGVSYAIQLRKLSEAKETSGNDNEVCWFGGNKVFPDHQASGDGWYGKFDIAPEYMHSPSRNDPEWDRLHLSLLTKERENNADEGLGNDTSASTTYLTVRPQFYSVLPPRPQFEGWSKKDIEKEKQDEKAQGEILRAPTIDLDFYLGLDEWIDSGLPSGYQQTPIDLFVSRIRHLPDNVRQRAMGHFAQQDSVRQGLTLEDAERLAALYTEKK